MNSSYSTTVDDITMIGLASKRSSDFICRSPALLFWVVLIFAQSCIFSLKVEARSFPGRTPFVELAPLVVRSSSSQEKDSRATEGGVEKLVKDDKRKVPMGPNPLHN
ncbi:hypothetical protein AAC387_Pa03g3109 [Persea americana]